MTLRKQVARQATRQAFTLMEILIVVAIIVILAGIGTVALFPQLGKAKENEARIKAAQVAKAISMYMNDHEGSSNPVPGDLSVLLNKDDYGGPYLTDQDAINDPWGQRYQFDATGSKFHNGGEPDVWTTSKLNNRTIGNFKGYR
jgi:general secretion pathway protein G